MAVCYVQVVLQEMACMPNNLKVGLGKFVIILNNIITK